MALVAQAGLELPLELRMALNSSFFEILGLQDGVQVSHGVKSLWCKHKALSSDPQHPLVKIAHTCGTCL